MDLVQNSEIDIDDVVRILMLDPALSAKILRLANSALYSHEKKVGTLQKAIMLIGLNGILSLALTFSLANSLRRKQGVGLDHRKFWRRALVSGSAGLALAQACDRSDQEELFMASFIQDIGMLVLDQVVPSLYAHPNIDQMSHQKVIAHEREHFGADHATVGSWLLQKWNFPEVLITAIRYSDEPDQAQTETTDHHFLQCVGFSGILADLSTSPVDDEELFTISEIIESTLKLPSLAFVELFKKIKQLVQESAPLFEIDCQEGFDPDTIMERARELLVIRNIQLDQKINTLSAQI
jgi:HD-like signal output (HDOD) protein